jgi:hypothetical protein
MILTAIPAAKAMTAAMPNTGHGCSRKLTDDHRQQIAAERNLAFFQRETVADHRDGQRYAGPRRKTRNCTADRQFCHSPREHARDERQRQHEQRDGHDLRLAL